MTFDKDNVFTEDRSTIRLENGPQNSRRLEILSSAFTELE